MALLNFSKISISILLSIIISYITQASGAGIRSNEAPKIEFIHLGEQWKHTSTSAGIRAIHSARGDDLFLSCKASYPIQWNISGVINPPEIVKIQPPRREIVDLSDAQKDVYKIGVNIFFLDANAYNELAASALIACESVEDYQNRDELTVFVKGNDPFVEPVGGGGGTVLDSYVIPCPTTDPLTSPTLYKKSSDGSEMLIQDVTYSPTEGFRSTSIFDGDYTCRKDRFAVAISAIKTPTNTGYNFSPLPSVVTGFSDEIIRFECESKSNKVNIIFDNSNKITSILKKNLEKEKIAEISVANNALGNDSVITGKVACTADEGSDKVLIKEWNYEIIKNPELYLDNIEGEADCLSTVTPKLVQTVRCKSSMDCNFMSQCLRNATLCNFKKQKQFYATTDTFCWIDEKQEGKECVSVPFSHLNGIAQCNVKGLTRKWEFFISLDYIRYTNWKDAPKRELVRLEEIEMEGRDGNPRLLCTASAYLFADSLIFQFQYKNGTKALVNGQEKNKDEQTLRPSSQSPRKIWELNVKAFLEKPSSEDILSVSCIAPFWNSTEYLIVTKNLRNGNIGFSNSLLTADKEKKLIFHEGEENRNLTCISNNTNTIWVFVEKGKQASKFENAIEHFPELKLGGEDDELVLIFPHVERKYAGIYKCTSSDGQIDIVKYKILVKEKPISTSTMSYTGLVILLLIITAVIIAILLVYARKRRESSK